MKTMKKVIFAVSIISFLTGCKANKEAYNATYERAKAKQETEVQASRNQESISVVEKKDVKEAAETITLMDNVTVNGNYGVVVGSFINRTNAESLCARMKKAGYQNCVLGQNEKSMYRVIVAFYVNKPDAKAMVEKLKTEFPDAWILIKE